MWNIKNNPSECIYKIETDIGNKFRITKGEGEGEIRSMGLTDTNYFTQNR